MSRTTVAPHEFVPMRRWFNHGTCRACYRHEDEHPVMFWTTARPLGDRTLATPPLGPER